MASFKYDAMHEPRRLTREDEPIDATDSKYERLKKRQQRATK